MSKKVWFAVSVVLIVALALTAVGCGGGSTVEEPEVIKIGAIFPLTGEIATFGQSSQEAIELALEEVNAAGGVLGKQVEIIFYDNKGTAAESSLAAEKLIESDGVVAILGPVASTNTLAAAPVAQDAGVVLMSPTSTNPAVTEVGDFIFRSCFIDPFQGQVAAQFALEDLEGKTAAILTDMGSDYSKGLRDVFEEAFTAGGGEVLVKEGFTDQDKDFTAILTTVKAADPDVVYIPSYYGTAGLILKQADEQGIDAYFLGADGWDSPQLFELAGDAANGGFFTNHYSPDASSPELDAFVAAYEAKYNGKTPDALAALAYDAAKLMFDAIERAGSVDSLAIRDALAATDGFVGVSGTITFDEFRNPIKSAVIIEIVDQAQVYKTTIDPK
ncbi:MAG: ABC transporter substrate-binding protein [Bacillota bacterium]